VSSIRKLGKLVDIRSKTSKQGGKGESRLAEDPLGEHGNSLVLSSREIVVDHPLV